MIEEQKYIDPELYDDKEDCPDCIFPKSFCTNILVHFPKDRCSLNFTQQVSHLFYFNAMDPFFDLIEFHEILEKEVYPHFKAVKPSLELSREVLEEGLPYLVKIISPDTYQLTEQKTHKIPGNNKFKNQPRPEEQKRIDAIAHQLFKATDCQLQGMVIHLAETLACLRNNVRDAGQVLPEIYGIILGALQENPVELLDPSTAGQVEN